jgi:hypothetical protein
MKPGERVMLSIQATPNIAEIRTAQLMDVDYTVIPCVCLVEGVLWPANAPAPELALAEEFGRFPQGWDGKPIMLGHPSVNGHAVSANSPGVLESDSIGQMFNTTLKGNKLHTEMWLNLDRVTSIGEVAEDTIKRLQDGDEVVEVSTGLFTMQEFVDGTFNGEGYSSVWRNIVPDHLAVLAEGVKGACSVEDGCGAPRTSKELGYWRNNDLAINSVRMSTGDAAAEAIMIGKQCGCGGTCDACTSAVEIAEEQKGLFQKLLEKGKDLFSFENNSLAMSDGDVRTALFSALTISTDRPIWIMAVFQDSDGTGDVVFEEGFDGTLFQQQFSINEPTGEMTISGDRIAVRPVTKFVPVEVTTNEELNVQPTTQQENNMSKEQLVQALITNEGTQYTDADSTWLNALEEDQLQRMTPVVAEEDPALEVEELIAPIAEEGIPTLEQYLSKAPTELQSVLSEGIKLQQSRKTSLVDGILANSRNTFSKEDLTAKDIRELEGIASLAVDISFEALGQLPVVNNADDTQPAPAPLVFNIGGSQENAA